MDIKRNIKKIKIDLLWLGRNIIHALIKLLIKKMADEKNRRFVSKKVLEIIKTKSVRRVN